MSVELFSMCHKQLFRRTHVSRVHCRDLCKQLEGREALTIPWLPASTGAPAKLSRVLALRSACVCSAGHGQALHNVQGSFGCVGRLHFKAKRRSFHYATMQLRTQVLKFKVSAAARLPVARTVRFSRSLLAVWTKFGFSPSRKHGCARRPPIPQNCHRFGLLGS